MLWLKCGYSNISSFPILTYLLTDISNEINYLITICKNDLRKTVADSITQR